MYNVTRVLAIIFIAFSVSCSHSAEKAGRPADIDSPRYAGGIAEIEFRSIRHNFGTVRHGEKLVYTFVYKNTGDAPLVIHSARADCGCTVPEYDTRPLAPGGEGKFKVIFDTQGFRGYQTKTIQLMTNARDPLVTLALRAMIE